MRPDHPDPSRPRGGTPLAPFTDHRTAAAESLLDRLRQALNALRPRRAGDLPTADDPASGGDGAGLPGWASLGALLRESGDHFAPLVHVAPGDLARELRRLLDALARIGAFVLHSDHLDDSALYAYLLEHCLPVSFPAAEAIDAVHILDLASGCDDSGESLYLKHYATDTELREFESATGHRVTRVAPANDRDRRLPRPPGWPPDHAERAKRSRGAGPSKRD